jgi:hypothetical protein
MEPEHAGKIIGERKPKGAQWRWVAVMVGIILLMIAAESDSSLFHRTPLSCEEKCKAKSRSPFKQATTRQRKLVIPVALRPCV